jgi:uncharacterized Zn finger protein (UPF0148 family)
MRHCDACGREFSRGQFGSQTCPYCGFNTGASPMPRTKSSLDRIERKRKVEEEQEKELNDYLDVSTD